MAIPTEEFPALGPQSGGLSEALGSAGGIPYQRASLQIVNSQRIAGLHTSSVGGIGQASQASLLIAANTAAHGIVERQHVGCLGDPAAGGLLQQTGDTGIIGGLRDLLLLGGQKDPLRGGPTLFTGRDRGSPLLAANSSVIT
jgi:hypothetical protein